MGIYIQQELQKKIHNQNSYQVGIDFIGPVPKEWLETSIYVITKWPEAQALLSKWLPYLYAKILAAMKGNVFKMIVRCYFIFAWILSYTLLLISKCLSEDWCQELKKAMLGTIAWSLWAGVKNFTNLLTIFTRVHIFLLTKTWLQSQDIPV